MRLIKYNVCNKPYASNRNNTDLALYIIIHNACQQQRHAWQWPIKKDAMTYLLRGGLRMLSVRRNSKLLCYVGQNLFFLNIIWIVVTSVLASRGHRINSLQECYHQITYIYIYTRTTISRKKNRTLTYSELLYEAIITKHTKSSAYTYNLPTDTKTSPLDI